MTLKYLASFLLGIGLLACTTTAQADFTFIIHDGNGGGNGGGNSDSGNGPKTYAILIGSQAPSDGIADAIRGDLDVDNVASKLSWASDVFVLKYKWDDPNTVAGDIQSAASAIAAKINPGDSFFFYYSGHGTGGSGLGVQDFINPVQSGGYQDNSLTSVFADSRYADANKFFLIDSCHSEGIWNNDSDGDCDLQTLRNISFLASSSENGVAYSDTDLNGTSYFTNALLPAITSDATYGSLLASAMSISGVEANGYFKDSGHGTGFMQPIGYTSTDFDWSATLGQPVPEPAALVLLLAAAVTALVWRRRIG